MSQNSGRLLFRVGLILIMFILQVASKGWFIAMVSTTVETANPEAEIQPGMNLLGPIKQKFLQVGGSSGFYRVFDKKNFTILVDFRLKTMEDNKLQGYL